MACEVKIFGKIRDFRKVQEYFGLGHDDNWLNSINHAISPTGDVIVLAQGEKIALLSTCWDTNNANTYSLSWCAELEDPNQIITCVQCLPMYGRNVSSGAEWTAVALGLNSGMVVFYTETGIKIFSQCCQEDPVLAIKVHTSPNNAEADPILYIIYERCICMLKGADTFPLLASLRYNWSRSLERNKVELPQQTLDLIPFHKYKFAREREMIVNDAVITTTQHDMAYDHIVAQSVGYGYFAKANSIPVQSSQVLAIGAEPFLGFYYAEEGYKLASIGEVAKDVIGMAYKNLLSGLFRRAPEPEPSPTDEMPSPAKEAQMRNRCSLYDGKRDGFSVAISPNGNLAAITDNLDRVMLVDTKRAIILRIWKGYRDAQCAFVPVKEKSLKGIKTHRRRALFLVIYAPRLGCLDIWALQNGPKVAAFTICKSGHLTYNTHGILGTKSVLKSGKDYTNFCLFLDPSDATVKEVQIPFHYALSETNSQTSRDIHMLRKLRNSLRSLANNTNVDLSEISKAVSELQTTEVRQQLLEILLRNKQLRPQVFQCIVHALHQKLEQEESLNEEHKHFQRQIRSYKRLVDFYIELRSPQKQSSDYIEDLELFDCDLVAINQLVILLSENDGKRSEPEVTFEPHHEEASSFIDYLNLFDTDGLEIRLFRNKSNLYSQVSNSLFEEFFVHGLCFAQFKKYAEQSCIPCVDLLVLVMHYWLDKPFTYKTCDAVIEDMSRLAAMIRAICELEGEHINDYAYNSISPWWQNVREMFLESKKSSGLLVAIICKTVAIQLWKSCREASCDEASQTEEEERWERISHDEAEWGLLIGKLEDVAILSAILENPISCLEPAAPEMPYDAPDCSLKFIVNGGKGIVTDLTAKWLISTRLHPSKLLETAVSEGVLPKTVKVAVENEVTTDREVHDKNIEKSTSDPNAAIDPVLKKLTLLRAHFPFSLESGVLLSNMSWHYMVHWSKNLSSLDHMRAAITCLEHIKREDWALKHGMCCMLWNATLKIPLQSTMKLMQKVGRLPIDKMCQQDIEISAGLVPDFLELSLSFLEQFRSSLDHDKRELKFEESLSAGPLPLQFIALQQHHAINELLQLHYEVCSVLYFIAFFQLKFPKPLTTLFDAMSNKAFQADINKELMFVLPAADPVLQQHRTDFLCRVVAETMNLIRQDLEQLYILEHAYYMSKICALADSWKLDKLPILRRQVVELYAYGYDTEAQLLLAGIGEDKELGLSLLEVAGMRMILYSKTSQQSFLKIASVGRQLLQYLDNLKETQSERTVQITATRPEEINLIALTKLITHAYKCLSRHETKQIHIAGQMYDACRLLQD